VTMADMMEPRSVESSDIRSVVLMVDKLGHVTAAR
jgi:hypothetical protein